MLGFEASLRSLKLSEVFLRFFSLLLGIGISSLASVGDLPRHASATNPGALCTYSVQAGLDGEIYPVFANYASLQKQADRSFAVVAVSINNPGSQAMRQEVAVQIPGWSDREVQLAEIPPGEHRTLSFAPSFLPRLYENREIVAATAEISVTDSGGNLVYESTVPVRLRSAEDMYWGADFKYAPFIASWVTPHDDEIEATLAQARVYLSDRRLPGYEDWKSPQQQEMETNREAEAIFNALQHSGLSYVKSSSTLGDHISLSERVRMPHTTLSYSSANCIDAVVAYASFFENLGMDAEVIIVPGHAYAGVRVAKSSHKFLVIDAALTGSVTFAEAVTSAERGLASLSQASVRKVLIPESRDSGIYPMPR